MKNENFVDTSDLDNNRTDKNVFLLKSALKTIFPSIGGEIFSEILGSVIPNQQIDRIIRCIREIVSVSEKQSENIIEIQTWIKKVQSTPANLLLFEQTIRNDAQTESETKHHCYAYYIFNTIKNRKYKDSQHEKILRTLSELTEEEILCLIKLTSPKIRIDAPINFEIESDMAFRDEYIITLEQKGLISIIMKYSGTKFPLYDDFSDVSVTNYGHILVNAIYDEDFFNKLTI